MKEQHKTGINVRRKVIIVFLLSGLSLGVAWYISRTAFTHVLKSVEAIAKPNQKLLLVGKLTQDIMHLDQSYRDQILLYNQNSGFNNAETIQVEKRLDSLKSLLARTGPQIKKIDSVKMLMIKREQLFKAYGTSRNKLVDNNEFTKQLLSLNTFIKDSSINKKDTIVITNQQEKRTTATVKEKEAELERPRGLFGLFKKRKTENENINNNIRDTLSKLTNNVFETYVDTIPSAKRDSISAHIDSVFHTMVNNQQQQSDSFIEEEYALNLASNVLVGQILNILREVETQASIEQFSENKHTNIYVNENINLLNMVFVGFLLIILILILLILDDIRNANTYRTRLEIAKEEAEYHSAAKQRFLSNMSHELRTPLQSIIGYAEQLKEKHKSDTQHVDVIYQSSRHLLHIVNEVLDYNRLNSGKFQLEEQAFILDSTLDNVVQSMQLQAEKKGLSLLIEKQFEPSCWLFADEFRLKQVLYNLLSNAIKFTDQGYIKLHITIEPLANDHSTLFLKVEDTGRGINQLDLQRIFNEFEQAEASNSGTHFGSGLGLSIVKSLCQLMGGTIHVKSKVGVGTSFQVELPVLLTENQEAPTPINPEEKTMPQEGEIWVIDDDLFILGLYQAIFDKHGIHYRLFSNPDEVLKTPITEEAHTFIMDMRMPTITGVELLKLVKKKLNTTHRPHFYACTAQALPDEQQHIISQGFDRLLIKPFNEKALLKLISFYPQQESLAPKTSVSFLKDSLQAMWTDNEKQAQHIFTLFIRDTKQDFFNLKQAYTSQNHETCSFIVHRLAGRIGQIGGKDLSFKLRKLEIDFNSKLPINEQEFSSVLKGIEEMADYVDSLLLSKNHLAH